MSIHVTHTDSDPTHTSGGYAYEGNVTVELDTIDGTHTRKYRRFIGPRVSVRPYRHTQRQDIHYPHPAPAPVTQPWPCACGNSYATVSGLMYHMYESAGGYSTEHYPL